MLPAQATWSEDQAHLGPFYMPPGSCLYTWDREAIKELTKGNHAEGASAACRPRKSFGGFALTITGHPDQLLAAKNEALKRIRANLAEKEQVRIESTAQPKSKALKAKRSAKSGSWADFEHQTQHAQDDHDQTRMWHRHDHRSYADWDYNAWYYYNQYYMAANPPQAHQDVSQASGHQYVPDVRVPVPQVVPQDEQAGVHGEVEDVRAPVPQDVPQDVPQRAPVSQHGDPWKVQVGALQSESFEAEEFSDEESSDHQRPTKVTKVEETKTCLSDGDNPKVFPKGRSIKVVTMGHKFYDISTLEGLGIEAMTTKVIEQKLLGAKTRGTIYLDATIFDGIDAPAGHCGHHYKVIKAIGEHPKFPVFAKAFFKKLKADRLHYGNKQKYSGRLHVVCIDEAGSVRALAVGSIVQRLAMSAGHAFRKTTYMHRNFWPCDSSCSTCDKKGGLVKYALQNICDIWPDCSVK